MNVLKLNKGLTMKNDFENVHAISAAKAISKNENTYFHNFQAFMLYTQYEKVGEHHMIDVIIATKVNTKQDSRDFLRATISFRNIDVIPFFHISLISENLDNSESANKIIVECKLDDHELFTKSHAAIKETKIMFDTKKYCDRLTEFLKEANRFDKGVFKLHHTIENKTATQLSSNS